MALADVTPGPLASRVVPIDGTYDLFGIEARAVADAVDRRRREFAAGREAARQALATLGVAPTPIPRADDRRPIWPAGLVGSISHAAGFAAAVAARDEDVAGVGLDIEAAAPLRDDLCGYVLTPTELRRRAAMPMVAGVPRCKVAFAAKEALFKAVYPITLGFFGFLDAVVDVGDDGSWTAVLRDPPAFPRADLRIGAGRWAAAAGMIAASVCIETGRAPPR